MYDLVIIGAGPAGLTGGLYAGRAGLNTIILDNNQSGGTMNNAPLIENYPGVDKVEGRILSKQMKEQVSQYVEIREFSNVKSINKSIGNTFELEVNDDIIATQYILLATGCVAKTLPASGIEEFTGRGVSYCAVCDGSFFVDKEVLVIGGGNSAATEALYLNRLGVKCSIVHRRDKLRCDAKLVSDLHRNNINIYWDSELESVNGDGRVEEAIIYNNKTHEKTTVSVDGIFIAIGYNPNNTLAQQLDLLCDDLGYIETDEKMKTSNENIYAAGDITGGEKQVVISAGQAATAVSHIQQLLL